MSRRVRLLVGMAVLALVAAACGGDDQFREGEGSKSIETAGIGVSASAPATVRGNVVSIDVGSKGVDIVKADGDTSGRSGHYHVFIDREPVRGGEVIPVEAGVVHSAVDPIVITGLDPGKHEFHVVLGNGKHERIGDYEDTVEVTVRGPSVDASVPAEITANTPFPVGVKADGVEIVPANGDTSGKSGHFHLFVDIEPPDPGQAVPTGNPMIIHSATAPITAPGLAPGEHTLWVVLGNGAHQVWDPVVMDKITVTVA
jgi:hypothetical protein